MSFVVQTFFGMCNLSNIKHFANKYTYSVFKITRANKVV